MEKKFQFGNWRNRTRIEIVCVCVLCALTGETTAAQPLTDSKQRIYYIKNVILWFRQCDCVCILCILPTSHVIIIIMWTVVYSAMVYFSSIVVHASHQIMLNAFRLPHICSIRWLTTMISLSVTMNGIWSLFSFLSTSASASTRTSTTTTWAGKIEILPMLNLSLFLRWQAYFFISTLGNNKWNERDQRRMATEYKTRCSKNENFSLSKCVRWRIKIHIAFKYARDRATVTATSSHYTNKHIYVEDGDGDGDGDITVGAMSAREIYAQRL